jgi:hypothetical protein
MTWVSSGLEELPIVILGFSTSPKARRYCIASLLLTLLTGILSASKSSLLQPILLVTNFVFILHQRGLPTPRSIVRGFVMGTICVAGVLPFYVYYVTRASDVGAGLMTFLSRLAGGFDQLIFWAISGAQPGNGDLSLAGIYFAPVLKLIGHAPKYNSAIDYLFTEMFGFSSTSEGMLPNSNLVTEALLTNGIFGGALIIAGAALICFGLRRYLMSRSELRIYHLFIYQFVVISPFMWLLDGQRFIVSMYTGLATYAAYAIIINIPRIYGYMRFRWV